MKRTVWMVTVLLVAGASVLAQDMSEALLPLFSNPPLPKRIEDPSKPASAAQIDLGRMLYYDTRFSIGQDISCNSCHELENFGVDGKAVSLGHKKQPGSRNSPTVYNAAGHFAQFWDYRAKTVEEQAMMPVLNPVEMAMPSKEYVEQVLKSIPGYVEAFRKAFPDDSQPVTFENFGKAIGVFERGLVTPSPWDKFLAGDKNAITPEQRKGFSDFIGALCHTCHMGPHLGGMMPQKLGVVMPWPSQKDKGRFEVTKSPADMMMFKVPSLRNIARTGPYFHDGSQESLQEAVKMMARHQSGITLTDEKAASIVKFLESLTGEIPRDYIKKPQLPPGGPETPAPKLD
jgi:cytochrome c peroxidase